MTKLIMRSSSIPIYLQNRLAELKINNSGQIKSIGYLEIFARLKAINPSLNFQSLFDLFCLSSQQLRQNLTQEQQRQLIREYKALPPRHAPLSATTLRHYLSLAEKEAHLAEAQNEIPIGAVIVYQEQVIARAYNRTRQDNNILAHAEIMAISQAQQHLANYRLNDCDLYVTIEPCLMCSGAIMQSRFKRIIFGAAEPKTGACCSQYQAFNNRQVNHHTQVIGPIDQNHYSQIISNFFLAR